MTYDRQTYKDKVMKPRAIPRILVRIDRGEDWVELSGDWQTSPPVCGKGNAEDWVDFMKLRETWEKANEAVME